MSEKPVDDSMLEEFLARRDPLSRRYREAAAEQPSAELDDAILAAARRAVDARPQAAGITRAGARRNWASRWSAPLAAAAVVVLAVALTVLLEREPKVMDFGESSRQRPTATVPVPGEPAALAKSSAQKQSLEAREPVPQALAPESAMRDSPAATMPGKTTTRSDGEIVQRLQQPAAETDFMSGAAADSTSDASPELKSLSKSKEETASRVAPSTAVPPVATPRALRREVLENAGPTLAPQARLVEIEGLYDQGRTEAADRALVVFCRDFPGYRLPDRLLNQVRRLSPDCPG